ncbi:MAG: hypothetical protein HRT88_20360, partial [Lentisphaeraceae bacterium]|nr:hypothetical protein [Lentisphaeraceae bacterium]
MTKTLLLLFFLSTCVLKAEEKSILFIGNSYTNRIFSTFTALLKYEKISAHVEQWSPGGRQLIQHRKNPKVIDKIKSRNWTYVVLQDQSQTPVYLQDKFFRAASELHEIIKAQEWIE